MKLVIYMNIPSHHQTQFFESLFKLNNKLKVFYYGKVGVSRKEMGWEDDIPLNSYESYIDTESYQFNSSELKEYIHIIPGYGHPFLVKLRNNLSRNKIKWIHWSENATPGWKWYASYHRKFIHAQFVNRYSLGALAIGEHAKKDFIRWGIDKSKIGILPYSFNSLPYYPLDKEILNFKNGRKAFLFVGSLTKYKGIDILLQAFAKEFKDNSSWCLILVGNKNLKFGYEKLAKKLSISSQVLFRGVVPSKYISSVYSAADVFILPSRYDGWGMVVNEAVFSQLPVIVSDAAGSSEHLVEHGLNGFVFRSGMVNDLSSYMSAYKNGYTIKSHKKNAQEVFSKFNSDAMARHLVNTLYKWNKK